MTHSTKRTIVAVVASTVAAALFLNAGVAFAGDDLEEVRKATARFHSITQAEKAGYVEFLECFDSAVGGMGQHYVNVDALDAVVDALAPESLVYEVVGERLKLVAVEYIVPGGLVDPTDPPELFGQPFHENPSLGVWVLHAWVWKHNPTGTFADYNPTVAACPK